MKRRAFHKGFISLFKLNYSVILNLITKEDRIVIIPIEIIAYSIPQTSAIIPDKIAPIA